MSQIPILLIPGNAKSILRELNISTGHYGWLLTPRRTMTKTGLFGLKYAVDNECFTLGDTFEPERYVNSLQCISELHGVENCYFATAPDVLYQAQATLDRFPEWSNAIRSLGFPVALVGQDGLEDLVIDWNLLDAIFIGGSTGWKLGQAAADLIAEARRHGKHTHVGRVNSFTRIDKLKVKPDTIDGTHLTKRPDIYAKLWQVELSSRLLQEKLCF